MSLTLVSALYDLAGREADPRRKTIAHYLEAGEFLFGLDADLVVFGDPGPIAEVEARRRAAGLGERTVAVPLPLEELRSHAELERITAARKANPVENANPSKDTPRFVVLQWGKFELLERAGALDPFAASHLAWIDLGLPFRPHPDDDVFAHPSDKVRLLRMRPYAGDEFDDRAAYFSILRGHLAAGYISGERDRILQAAREFEDLARETLDNGFAPSEEQLLPILCEQTPDAFDFHFGDYDEILVNYLRVRAGAANLLFQLRVARDAELPEPGLEICEAILASLREGTLDCSPAELAELLDECFLAAWYAGDDSDRSLPREIHDIYRERTREDPEFRDIFLRDEIRVRSNFQLLGTT